MSGTPAPLTRKELYREVFREIWDHAAPGMTVHAAETAASHAVNVFMCSRVESSPQITVENVQELKAELERLQLLLNSPEIIDFAKALPLEAAHQRERWETNHDAGKTPADWFWLIGYLAGKALHSLTSGNTEKALHHVITTAAALCNWHAAILGKTNIRPGIQPPPGEDA